MENISGFYMSTPFTIPVITAFIGMIIQNDMLLYFSSALAFTDIFIVQLLKFICKFIYNYLEVTDLPILGRGIRPDGAVNCGCFIDKDNVNKLATSFGMPSGHSIVAGFIMAFLYKYITDTFSDTFRRNLAYIAVFLFTFTIAISRILLNCHTIQQVIIGFIIGLFLGKISYNKKYLFLDNI